MIDFQEVIPGNVYKIIKTDYCVLMEEPKRDGGVAGIVHKNEEFMLLKLFLSAEKMFYGMILGIGTEIMGWIHIMSLETEHSNFKISFLEKVS